MTIPISAAIMTVLAVAALVAENWPQWGGPLLNGVSREIDDRQRLRSATYSRSPSVADGRICVTDEDA